nr:SDR family NAD(P)-dependent oxidoreductase [Lysobacter sp.]
YVVIGGAGGLGEVWTRHMVAHYDAEVIWVGRRQQDADIEAKLDAIAGLGRQPHYFSADATDAAALATAVAAIRERFPRIDGVVHSALVLQDQTVRAMDEAVFRQSLAAKVDVSVNIERAFAGQDLDFVLFFSSDSSFHRAAGQSNYCAGCTFADSFAQSVRARHPYPVKIVNWGYWGSVGVVTDAFYRKRMESLGIGSIEPDEAMRELEAFVASDMDQLALIKVISERGSTTCWCRRRSAFTRITTHRAGTAARQRSHRESNAHERIGHGIASQYSTSALDAAQLPPRSSIWPRPSWRRSCSRCSRTRRVMARPRRHRRLAPVVRALAGGEPASSRTPARARGRRAGLPFRRGRGAGCAVAGVGRGGDRVGRQ